MVPDRRWGAQQGEHEPEDRDDSRQGAMGVWNMGQCRRRGGGRIGEEGGEGRSRGREGWPVHAFRLVLAGTPALAPPAVEIASRLFFWFSSLDALLPPAHYCDRTCGAPGTRPPSGCTASPHHAMTHSRAPTIRSPAGKSPLKRQGSLNPIPPFIELTSR